MTQATWSGVEVGGRPQVSPWTLMIFAASLLIMLTFSEGWVFPLRGDANNTAFDKLIPLGYLPAYAAGAMLFALAPVSTVMALIRQPFLIALMLVVGASIFWSWITRRSQSLVPAYLSHALADSAIVLAAVLRA